MNYIGINDIKNLDSILKESFEIKSSPLKFNEIGQNKTLTLIFFNASLRTRLSTQIAAQNLGLNVIVMNIGEEGWKIETEYGVIMDGDKAEHIKEAAGVIGKYSDIIGIRAFANLENKELDYSEPIISKFVKYAEAPIISLESATGHPLQSLADLITIEQYKKTEKPKVVLSWAPHPRALPQAVPNSFCDFMNAADYNFVITHPEGYELDEKYTQGAKIEYDQNEAFKDADFIYAKNWSSLKNYGKVLSKDKNWTINENKMNLTNNAKFMHCLPVRRNMVVSDEVLDSPNSVVIGQAANRVVSAQVVLKNIIESLPILKVYY